MIIENTPQVGKQILKTQSKEVADFSGEKLQQVITDLTDTMRSEDLVGMAAPQIDEELAVFVMEVRKTKYRDEGLFDLEVFINPKITSYSEDKSDGWEGCGSVLRAGLFAQVYRSNKVELEWQDKQGEKHTKIFDGLLARVVQHETDHLNGKLFLESVKDTKSFMDRDSYIEMKDSRIIK